MLPVVLSKPPRKLGRFEVGAKIGGGGMATVFLGRSVNDDGTEQLVALKVMKDELAHDEQFLAMFEDEAKILARLSHPNVIQTLEFGSGDCSFIAMELLNGRTVADAYDALHADGERFDHATAAWICARVAEGLHSAHELVDEEGAPLSVIHRDVNPTNIFLTHSGEVKLIDFGLARARVRMSKSAEGIVKGKIPYLAPEQAQGKTIDRRIDVYALGTTLWEMCSMQRLFKRDNDVDTLRAIREALVPDLREIEPGFPDALWKVIDLSLRVDRDERYATAEEMRTDLDSFARTTGPHGPKVAALVSRLFPGGEARQAKWLHDAATVREGTMTPPAPVPIASSSMLEVSGGPKRTVSSQSNQRVDVPIPRADVPTIDSRPPAAMPESAVGRAISTPTPGPETADTENTETPAPMSRRSSVRPPSRKSIRPAKPVDEDPDAPPPKSETAKSSPPASDHDIETMKSRHKKLKRRSPKKTSTPPPRELAEDKRKLWMIVGGAVLLLIVIALLASR